MVRIALLVLLVLLAGCEPTGPIPGGALSGEVIDTPIDWQQVAAINEFQLETRPADPYSVNVWGVGVEDSFYVAAGGGAEASWTAHIAENPDVRLRVDGSIYELRAIKVEDEFELHNVRLRYMEKYDLDEGDSMTEGSWVYRLDPRMDAMTPF